MPRKVRRAVCGCCESIFYTTSPLAKWCSIRCTNRIHHKKLKDRSQADLEQLYLQQQAESSADLNQI